MNIVAIIPARAGSKGLKNKNIYPILSKPLIQWTIDQVKKSKLMYTLIHHLLGITINDFQEKQEKNL